MSTLDLTLGALEISVLLSTGLYGIATLQAFLYSERNVQDPIWLRIMVGLVWVFETVHTVIIWILLYSLTVTNYGRPSAILETPWSLAMTIPFTSLIGSTVQVFFAYRVKALSGRLLIPVIAWIGAVLRLAFGIMLGVVVIDSKTIPNFFQHYQWLVNTQLVLDAAVDILNTSSLCFYLVRRRSGFKATQRVVDKLIMYTVETGLMTSLCAVSILICSLVMPHNFIYLSIFMIYPKLFSNSLFTSLNTRQALRQKPTSETAFRITGAFAPQYDTENSVGALELSPKQSFDHTQAIHTRISSPSPSFNDSAAHVTMA